KQTRSHGKNSFVFPILYGSYWGSVAYELWHKIDRWKLSTVDGVGLYDVLKSKGINRLGDKKNPESDSFYAHIKRVEENFNNRFKHWSTEKVHWWSQYEDRGWFPLMTGFVCSGVYSYNNLMN